MTLVSCSSHIDDVIFFLYTAAVSQPPKLSFFPLGDLDTHLIHGSLGPSESSM